MPKRHALVSGHRGFIGAHLVSQLRDAGYRVTGVDLGYFDGCEWTAPPSPDTEWRRDVRALTPADLDGVDVVCHLAAISNDPMGDLDPGLTDAVNRGGTIHLARVAKAAGVQRFLFASSCSVYGKVDDDATEDAPLNPLSAYARSKIDAESQLLELADSSFSPVFLRNATAFGHSPMLRIDLVANNLLASAVACGSVRVLTDGSPWRPLVHCADIARAFVAIADAPRERTHAMALNIGADTMNFRVRDIAERVGALVPAAPLSFSDTATTDPRDYRVSFARFARLFPDFRLAYDLDRGLEELLGAFRRTGFTQADFDGPRFVRLRTLKARLTPASAS